MGDAWRGGGRGEQVRPVCWQDPQIPEPAGTPPDSVFSSADAEAERPSLTVVSVWRRPSSLSRCRDHMAPSSQMTVCTEAPGAGGP